MKSFVRFAATALSVLALMSGAEADDLRRAVVGDGAVAGSSAVAPAGEPNAIVVIVSDADGWTPARTADAEALAREGAIAIGIDLPRWIEALGKIQDPCVWPVGDIEDVARLAGKIFGLERYRLPVMLGVGAGGDLAYAMLAQAPANMLTGAVSLGFSARAPFPKPLCDGPKSETRDGAVAYLPPAAPPHGTWRVVSPGPATDAAKAFAEPAEADIVEAAAGDASAAARTAALEIGRVHPFGVDALPLALYPPEMPNPRGLAIIYSGDGGWRDLDKTIGEALQKAGFGVVGVDALRYFWNEKSPRELADDLESIVARYGREWKTQDVLLAGYSFGADAIPFAWGLLPQKMRDRVRLITLLSLSKTADFEISVAGWLGTRTGAHDVTKASAALPMERVMCIYGAEEVDEPDADVGCVDPVFPEASRVKLPGGHHFDGDYAALARSIEAAYDARPAHPKR